MAFEFFIPPILKHYILSRWCCVRCGWFETGTIIALHAALCPQCQMPALPVEKCCECQTTRSLPFASKPRKEATPDGGAFQITHAKGIVDRIGTDQHHRRRGGLRATGRPKKKKE
jgi:hypothetical protein